MEWEWALYRAVVAEYSESIYSQYKDYGNA